MYRHMNVYLYFMSF